MFKLGETHYTKAGYEARIICVDATYKVGAKSCPIVALITVPTSIIAGGQLVYFFGEDGKYLASGNTTYDLVSNEPNSEEAALIGQMLNLAEGGVERKEEALLKIIRQLRWFKK